MVSQDEKEKKFHELRETLERFPVGEGMKLCIANWHEDCTMPAFGSHEDFVVRYEDIPSSKIEALCYFNQNTGLWDTISITNIEINEQFCKKGYGAKLVNTILDIGKEIGVEEICGHIDTRKINDATGFYEKMGFEIICCNGKKEFSYKLRQPTD